MYGISRFFKNAYSSFSNINGDLLIALDLGSFVLLFIITVISCIFSRKVKSMDKKPFFHLTNLFTAITAAVFLTEFEVRQALLFSCVFWFAGYCLYGILCALSKTDKKERQTESITVSSLAAMPPLRECAPVVPAAKNAVRLEHALSITDKLMQKNLAKGDRQELEKMKTTLSVLQVKEVLSPQEGEILNESFNTLLKLMAKYNL
jgi:Ca2+/Na+ antiporter